MTEDQLQDLLKDLKKEQFNLRFQQATNQLENTARMRQVRRDTARGATILNEKAAAAASTAIHPMPLRSRGMARISSMPKMTGSTPLQFANVDAELWGLDTAWRYDLLEKRCQLYGDTAIVSYTFMLSQVTAEGITHRTHNESRVLVKEESGWQIVHVHKSPAYGAPYGPATDAGH